MDGPFTCEDLRNISPRVIQAELDKFIDLIVQDIKKSIIDKASTGLISVNSNEMLYGRPTPLKYQVVYETNRMRGHRLVNMNILHKHINTASTIQEVIKKTRAIFPDMKIVVDPLETYILFDWSA